MGRKAKAPEDEIVARPGINRSEHAVFCWLRLNPAVAITYGIEECGEDTRIGSMLLQTLEAQGMGVTYFERLPNGVDADKGTPNERGALWINKVGR